LPARILRSRIARSSMATGCRSAARRWAGSVMCG
jgi:hypothetical protein